MLFCGGVRQTLAILQRYIPLGINEVPKGTSVLDWTVPREWNIRDAYVARQDGTCIVDFGANNLHVVQYSRPIDAIMPLAKLRPHLHSLPDQPDWIPYRTSYYSENWGFCLTHRRRYRDAREVVVSERGMADMAGKQDRVVGLPLYRQLAVTEMAGRQIGVDDDPIEPVRQTR
jgi:aminopeptidase-like protein